MDDNKTIHDLHKDFTPEFEIGIQMPQTSQKRCKVPETMVYGTCHWRCHTYREKPLKVMPKTGSPVLSITSNTSIPFKFLPSIPSLPSLPSIPLFHLSLPSFPYFLLPFIYPCLHLYSSICETIFYHCTPLSAFLYSTELVNSLFIY